MLNKVRENMYKSLAEMIGSTPLARYQGEVPNGNKVWIKRECDNPFGSHYDRVYLALFRDSEQLGKMQPGGKVLETTSGNAGVSFAGIGRLLGYECHVAIPEGVDNAVVRAIKEQNAALYFTPEKDYIAGFPKFIKEFGPKRKGFVFLNHSMGDRHSNNEVTLSALEGIAGEVASMVRIDYFIPAVGNGSSIVGPGRILKETAKVVAFESAQSAVAFDQKYPGRYEVEYGIKPGTLPRHRLRGTSFQGVEFPHIKTAVSEGIIEDVVLIGDANVNADYFNLTKRRDFEQLPRWDLELHKSVSEFGRSTKAGIAVALEIAKKVSNKNLLVIAYDKACRYDDWIG